MNLSDFKLCRYSGALGVLSLLLAGVPAVSQAKPVETKVIVPADGGSMASHAKRGHGGPNIRADFSNPKIIHIDFEHKAGSDDYIHIDLGQINLSNYAPGGYLEFTIDCTNPIVQAGVMISSPELFWETRLTLEGLFSLKEGKHTYRIYFDSIVPGRRKSMETDRVFLFLRDMKSTGFGKSTLTISNITFFPQKDGWQAQKKAFYDQQFPPLPDYERIEEQYREDFTRGVNWQEINSSAFVRGATLDGRWKKKFFGERYWDRAFLMDTQYAEADYADADWQNVTVPEAPIRMQQGGYYWYRKQFEMPKLHAGERVYVRLDDISEEGSIYLNGQLVGTQSSVDKAITWLGEGLGRTAVPPGSMLSDVMDAYFKRYEIPVPFDLKAIPEDAQRIAYPIYTGEFVWPLAYDITDLLQDGTNTLAVRIHGNPLRGHWIYRHPEYRAAQNVFGILGSVTIASERAAVIAEFDRKGPQTVDVEGNAIHEFSFQVTDGADGNAAQAVIQSEGQRIVIPLDKGDGAYAAAVTLPARFADYSATLTLFDGQGRALDQRAMRFYGSVVYLDDLKLMVNGEPFIVRGICSQAGVEWSNDRRVTKREFLRLLRMYQQMGINTIRMDATDYWQLEAAFEHGIMVLPILSNASTDLSAAAFGRVEDPDLELALDRQRLGILLYREAPNILIWNTGNEISHMPGRDDKANVERFLAGIPEVYEQLDPSRRLTMYSSYDAWVLGWFFPDGDIVGWNFYGTPEEFAVDIVDPERMAVFNGRPFLFTEWGLDFNQRRRNVDNWEQQMRAKWEIKTSTPGSIGGCLYPWHGEMDDDRGREFLRSLFLPFTIERNGAEIRILNRGEASMREISVQVVDSTQVWGNEFIRMLAPGQDRAIAVPEKAKGTLEIRYESHGGLKHFYTQQL